MPDLRIEAVRTSADLEAALEVRRVVFIEEHVPEAEEIDRFDTFPTPNAEVVLVLGRLDGVPIATGRLLLETERDGLPHIGRVAVLASERGNGYGRAIMSALHEEARSRGFDGATLAAQTQALEFYAKLGYIAHGPIFLDAGIEHRQMDLRFSA